MGYMRLSEPERKALKTALTGFKGEVYLFGSRIDAKKRGGDIDILLKPSMVIDRYELKMKIASKFERALEQSLDVVVYDGQNLFCQEISKYAQPIDIASL